MFQIKKFLIIIIIIFLIINTSGCINTQFNKENKKIYWPQIYIYNGELYILWSEYVDNEDSNEPDFTKRDYIRKISIINEIGKIIIDKRKIKNFPKEFFDNYFIIENSSMNIFSKVHIDERQHFDIQYIQLNLNFDININKKIIVNYNELEQQQKYITTHRITINKQSEFFIIWSENKKYNDSSDYEIEIVKVDNCGNKLINYTQLTFDPQNDDESPLIFCDTTNTIHIKWRKKDISNYYMKLSNAGEILINATPLEAVAVLPGYPVIKDDLGNLLYLGDYGVVDSKNNIHVFSQIKYENKWVYNKLTPNGTYLVENRSMESIKSFFPQLKLDSLDNIHLVWEENNHIYYTKLDDDGNKLIDKMKIV